MPKMLVVSLACLLQYGSHEKQEVAQRVLQHAAFRAYEQGTMPRTRALAKLGTKYQMDIDALDNLLAHVRACCQVDTDLWSSLQGTGKPLIGWIDIPAEEWQLIWPCFESLWPQFMTLTRDLATIVGEKQEGGAVIIDKDSECASIHNSIGWQAVVYSPMTKVECMMFLRATQLPMRLQMAQRSLQNIFTRTQLRSTIQTNNSFVKQVREYFSPCLVACCLGHMLSDALVQDIRGFIEGGRPFGFYGTDISQLPADVDTMALCASTLLDLGHITPQLASRTLDIVLRNVDHAGTLHVYFDPERPRQDVVVLANVLYLAYSVGREDDPVVRRQEARVQQFLLGAGYVWGTKYYPQQESFLYHYGRVVNRFGMRIPRYLQVFEAMRTALISRVGVPVASLHISKRLILSPMFNLPTRADVNLLLQLQLEDGSWAPSDLYVLPTTKGCMFNQVVDMCFAVRGLEGCCVHEDLHLEPGVPTLAPKRDD